MKFKRFQMCQLRDAFPEGNPVPAVNYIESVGCRICHLYVRTHAFEPPWTHVILKSHFPHLQHLHQGL